MEQNKKQVVMTLSGITTYTNGFYATPFSSVLVSTNSPMFDLDRLKSIERFQNWTDDALREFDELKQILVALDKFKSDVLARQEALRDKYDVKATD